MKLKQITFKTISRKQLIALSIAVGLILSVGIAALVLHYYAEILPERELNNADLAITEFDIVGVEDGKLRINGTLRINGEHVNGGEATMDDVEPVFKQSDVDVEHLVLELSLGGKCLGIIDTEPESQEDESNVSFSALIDPPSNDGDQEGALRDFIGNIMNGVPFYLDVEGELSYKRGLIRRTLEFTNTIDFLALRDHCFFEMVGVDIPTADGSSALLIIEIDNPFTATLSLLGELEIRIEDSLMGTILLDPPIFVPFGAINVTMPLEIAGTPADQLQNLFAASGSDLLVSGDLTAGIDDLTFDVAVSLEVPVAADLLVVSVLAITNATIIELPEGSYLMAIMDIGVTNNSPMSLNISSVNMTITTLSNRPLGILQWNTTESVTLYPYSECPIQNMTLICSELTTAAVIDLLLDGAICIPYGELVFDFFGEEFCVVFHIDDVPLSLYP